MCGVSACENWQNRVSHGESVRVGSSASVSLELLHFRTQGVPVTIVTKRKALSASIVVVVE